MHPYLNMNFSRGSNVLSCCISSFLSELMNSQFSADNWLTTKKANFLELSAGQGDISGSDRC